MGKKYQRRRVFIVDRVFQYRLIGTFLLSTLLALVIFSSASVLYYWASSVVGDNLFREFIDIKKQVYTWEQNERGESVRVPGTKTIYGVKRWEIIVPPILINNLIVVVVIAVTGLFYSHRIAGPAYRICKELQRVIDGESGARVRLRKGDKLQDLAGLVNELLHGVDELRTRIDAAERQKGEE